MGSAATLGVIPLGSGNLLATDLLLPKEPAAAARALLTYQPRDVCPGVITYQTKAGQEKRYVIVAAGVGADACPCSRLSGWRKTARSAAKRWR